MGTGRGQPVGGAPLDFEWKLCSNEELGIRNEGGGFAANIYGGDARKWWGAAIRGKRISNIRGSQPRLATLDSPFQRKGRECGSLRVYQSLLPLEGGARRAEVRAQSGVKKERLKQAIYESTRAPLTRSPFPDGEGLGGATLRVDFL